MPQEAAFIFNLKCFINNDKAIRRPYGFNKKLFRDKIFYDDAREEN